jgi:hypothetical protein
MRLIYTYKKDAFAQTIANVKKPIARAATAAMKETADLAKQRGRASIQSAGFSTRWSNALRAKVYPDGRDSMGPAAVITHNIPYANIFEEGGTISGNPLLWLPIEANLPLQSGGRRWTPKAAAAALGPLRYVKRASGPPLLVADVVVGHSGVPLALPSRASSRKGARARAAFSKNQKTRPLVVFVGISTVNIRKKFAIREAVLAAANAFPGLYQKHVKD